MSASPSIHPLHGNQMKAVEPDETVWLSASAGTGKTQVLSSRVLRLLLKPGVEPSQILCLTFTKAGATEMAGSKSLVQGRFIMDAATACRNEDRTRFHPRIGFSIHHLHRRCITRAML